jgi:restriction system protein
MSIPDFQSVMLPILETLSDGQLWTIRNVTEKLAGRFGLTEAEKHELLPSGQQSIFSNRVAWAKTHLKMAGLIENPSRGTVRLSDMGKQVLAKHPTKIDLKFLHQFPSYVEFKKKTTPHDKDEENDKDQDKTPEESLESSYKALRLALAEELLEKLKGSTSDFFEQTVVKLLVAMGYGGSLADAGQAIGKVGDEGIDGVIKEDKLGLDLVCIQAKRYKDTVVGRPVIQAFAGSLEGFRARKGVFITTSSFSAEAREYVNKIERKIVLIDGAKLVDYMIEYNIGVTTSRSYDLKKVDLDFFAEEA